MASVAAILGLGLFTGTAGAGPVADYRFEGNLESSVPGADDAFVVAVFDRRQSRSAFGTESVAGCSRRVLGFAASEGVGIHTKDLIGSGPYTMIVQVRFETLPAEDYVRVINWFPSLANDNGLYLYDGKLDFYDNNVDPSDHAGATQVAPNEFAEFAVTRDASKLIRGYVNGVPQFSYTDAFDQAVSSHPVGNVYFFLDNTDEESAGAVARIRVYDEALPESRILNTVGCFDKRCGGQAVTVEGDDRGNVLTGTPGRDVVAGLGGDDTIRGLAANDVLCGNAGRDRLIGGKGGDRLLGGPGRDTLLAGKGRDRLLGGPGRDLCRGGAGRDIRRRCERGRG